MQVLRQPVQFPSHHILDLLHARARPFLSRVHADQSKLACYQARLQICNEQPSHASDELARRPGTCYKARQRDIRTGSYTSYASSSSSCCYCLLPLLLHLLLHPLLRNNADPPPLLQMLLLLLLLLLLHTSTSTSTSTVTTPAAAAAFALASTRYLYKF